MNNEEKILSILESMQAAMNERFDSVEGRFDSVEERLIKLEADVSEMKEDIEIVKEDSSEIRSATNTLLNWVERAEVVTKVKLFPKTSER